MSRSSADFDRIFLLLVLALLGTGIVVVYSACQTEDPGLVSGLWKKQLVFAGVGLLALLASSAISHLLWHRFTVFLYVAALALLVAVLLVGTEAGGATRWIRVGGIRFQPSELAKIATVLLVARDLAGRRRPPQSVLELVRPLMIVLIPTALVLRQPDLGTALVFLVMLPPMLFWAGTPLSYLLLLASPFLAVLCAFSFWSWIPFVVFLLALAYLSRALYLEKILIVSLSIVLAIVTPKIFDNLKDYQQKRLVAFVNPPNKPSLPRPADEDQREIWDKKLQDYRDYISGAGYQIIQSKVAVGSGGLSGVGFLQGTQKRLAFLPARHTDFIFSVVGEEFGFLGTFAVLTLFALLVARGLRLAASARDPFASLTAVGILSMLAFQVFVNIGVALGLMPVTGLPLPIYSYGGTSLITTLGGLGIVLGVGLRRRI